MSLKHEYGEFTSEQVAKEKKALQSSIFFLLLAVDPKTADRYPNVDVDKTFTNLLRRISGLNTLLFCQRELVEVMSYLEEARTEYNKDDFDFGSYRNLVLTAGAEVMKLKEVDDGLT